MILSKIYAAQSRILAKRKWSRRCVTGQWSFSSWIVVGKSARLCSLRTWWLWKIRVNINVKSKIKIKVYLKHNNGNWDENWNFKFSLIWNWVENLKFQIWNWDENCLWITRSFIYLIVSAHCIIMIQLVIFLPFRILGCRSLNLDVDLSSVRVVLEESGGCVRDNIWPEIQRSPVWQVKQFVLLLEGESWKPRGVVERDPYDWAEQTVRAAKALLKKLDKYPETYRRLSTLAFLACGEPFLKVNKKLFIINSIYFSAFFCCCNFTAQIWK